MRAAVARHLQTLFRLAQLGDRNGVLESVGLSAAKRRFSCDVCSETRLAVRRFTPQPFAGRVILFLPSREGLRPGSALLRWRAMARASEEYCGPDGCIGTEMLQEPWVHHFAELFRRCCDRAESGQMKL